MPTPAAAKPMCQLIFWPSSRRQRRDERAEVDAHVEEGEAGVAPRIVARVKRSDDGADVRLEQSGADARSDQAREEKRQAPEWPS